MAGTRIGRVARGKWTAARRKALLGALAESGNVALACAAAGLSTTSVYRRRRADAALREDWGAALAGARERLRAERRPGDGIAIRGSREGFMQMRRARPDEWGEATEAAFLATLAATANVKAAARAARRSPTSAYRRRRRWPAFARAWDDALEDGIARLEWLLIEHATNMLAPPRQADGEAADAPPPDPKVAFDLLKYHLAKKGGAPRRGGRPAPPRDMGAVRDSVLAKLAAIERHRNGR